MWNVDLVARSGRPRIRIAVVGAGGIGGPLCYALAAAGVELRVFDPDVVDASNLHRQVQFALADLGHAKATVLSRGLTRRGGDIVALVQRWRRDEADITCSEIDLIVDGSDDPATKFAVADWATASGRPSVIAAALGTSGNVFLSAPGYACFRCLFEAPPTEAPTCAEAGVLGPVVAKIAGLAALAALQLASGVRSDAGTIWVLDDALRSGAPRRISVERRADCRSCLSAPPLHQRLLGTIPWPSC